MPLAPALPTDHGDIGIWGPKVLAYLGYLDAKPSGSSGTLNDIYTVATADTSSAIQAAADVVLPASGTTGLAAAIKSAIETYRRVKVIHAGNTLVLDAQLSVTCVGGEDVDFNYLPLQVWSGDATGGQSGNAAIVFGPSSSPSTLTVTGLPSTIAQGVEVITHTSGSLPSSLTGGDWVQFQTSEIHNPNRPGEYYKGELLMVDACTSTDITFRGVTRDSYLVSQPLTLKKVPFVSNVRIRRANIISNGSGSARQNGLVVKWVIDPVLEDCHVTGVEFADGIGVWGCIDGWSTGAGYNVQDRYGPGVQGYGLRVAGCEGHQVRQWDAFACRHGFDAGQSSQNWPVTRHTAILAGTARRCYAAGYAIHDGEHVYFGPGVAALDCGGGFISRAPFTVFDRVKVVGGQAVTYPWGAGGVAGGSGTQAVGAGITVGERKKLSLGTFDDTASDGRAGEGLQIIDPYIDLSNAVGDFDGIQIQDPLIGARIEALAFPIKPKRCGVIFTGDTMDRTTIRVLVDHVGSYSGPTSAAVTGATAAATGDLVTAAAHGLTNGQVVTLTAATGAAGLYVGAAYFVLGATTNTFQLAQYSGGVAIDITSNGSAMTFAKGGKPVNSVRLTPSLSTVSNAQYIRDSSVEVTSYGPRDTAVVVGGARNGGTNTRNKIAMTVATLGSGPTATTPMLATYGVHADIRAERLTLPATNQSPAILHNGTVTAAQIQAGYHQYADTGHVFV